MPVPRLAWATAAAGAAALFLATHAFVDIDLHRVKVVQTPVAAVDGRVPTSTASFPQVRDLVPPFALIGRIRNQSSEARVFSVAVDGDPVCRAQLPANAARRFDCVVTNAWNPASDHVVSIATVATVSGPPATSSQWTLEYLELATHHGGTTGAHVLIVLPGSSDRYVRPSALVVALTFCAVFAILLIPGRRLWATAIWRAYTGVAGALILFLVAIQCSQWFTSYRVVLAVETFYFWLFLFLGPRIWLAIRWSVRQIEARGERVTRAARAGFIAVLAFIVFGAVVRANLRDAAGNYSGSLQVSEVWFGRNPLVASRDDVRRALVLRPGGGYDGQFMYFAAFDPFLRAYKDSPRTYRQVMDAPPYRYGRIGYSLLTIFFSGGRWERYPTTMVWLILVSLTLVAGLLALMAQENGLSAAIGLLVLAVPGFWQSVQFGLPEPIAAAALLGGLVCLSRARWVAATTLLGLSLLVRETGVVAIGCVLVATLLSERRWEALLVGLFAFGVMVLWRLYVAWILFPDWGFEGLLFHPPDLGWPLAGFLDLWKLIGRGQYYPGRSELTRAGVAYPLLLVGGFVLACALTATRRSAVHVAAVVYGLIAICLNYSSIWVHVGNGQRGTYELFLMLAMSCLAIRTYPKLLQRGLVVFWSCCIAYVFFLGFDAYYIRSALAVPF